MTNYSLPPPPSKGRTKVSPLDIAWWGAASLLLRNRDVYIKTWRTNFLPPLLEPLLYLLSLGYGLGQLVRELDGVSYAQFVAPAILGMTMMQSAFFETTYGSFVRMWFQKTWDAATATPLTLDDVLVGELLWGATKSTVNAGLMSVVIAGFGLLPWTAIPAMIVLSFVVGLMFAGIGLMISSRVKTIDAFQYSIYLLITPMMLFSGTFFPLAQLPIWAQNIAMALPLTHAVLIARPLTYAEWAVPWTSIVYIVVASIVTCYVAIRFMKKRLMA